MTKTRLLTASATTTVLPFMLAASPVAAQSDEGIARYSQDEPVVIETNEDIVVEDDIAILAVAPDVSVTTGEGTTTSGTGGIYVYDSGTIAIANNGTVIATASDNAAIAAGSNGEGGSTIVSDTAIGTGAFRSHGILAFGEGPVTIVSQNASSAGDGSAGIVATASGDISITSGQVATSGNSVDTVVDQDGVEQAGAVNVVGAYRADGILAFSGLGSVTIDSGDVTTTGVSGGIFAGLGSGSDGVLTVDVTGDILAGVYGVVLNNSNLGAAFVTVAEGNTVSAGYQGIYSTAGGDKTIANYGTIEQTEVASGFSSAGINLERPSSLQPQDVVPGTFAIDNFGTISAANVGVNLSHGGGILSNAAGASITGDVAIARSYNIPDSFMQVLNDGAITGTSGTAIDLASALVFIENTGTITGDVGMGGGTVYNFGTIDGDVTFGIDGQQRSLNDDTFLMGVDGEVTGTIDAGGGVDAFGFAFTSDGTATLDALPDTFERHAIMASGADTVVTLVAGEGLAGPTSVLLSGEGSIVNQVDLSAEGPARVLFTNAVAFVSNPAGGARFVFAGGVGLSSVTNEAAVTGRLNLTTAEFVNSGELTTGSSELGSFITANSGEAFSFSNTGSIVMLDTGAAATGDPENYFNLPVAAINLRSPVIPLVQGQPDLGAVYHPVSITNEGEIDGGLLARFTASTLDFTNTGTILGFAGGTHSVPGVTLLVGTNYESFEPTFTRTAESVSFDNSGEIAGGVVAELEAEATTFGNSGTIAGGTQIDATGSVTVDNTGTLAGPETGADSAALGVNAGGDIAIASNEVISAADGGYGIRAESALGNITIDSGSIVMTGDHETFFVTLPEGGFELNDSGAIRAAAYGGDIDLRVDDISAQGENGRGIYVEGRNVDITVDGTIETTATAVLSTGVSGPQSSGNVEVLVNGTIESGELGVSTASRFGTVEIAEGASVSGTMGGVSFTVSGQNAGLIEVYNNGTIQSADGTAVQGVFFGEAPSDFYIYNNGTLTAGQELAVVTGGGNDTAELTELSQISGILDLGEGQDRLVLAFNEDAASDAVGQVAQSVNVERLVAESGTWVADGPNAIYQAVEVAGGAMLTISEDANGVISVAAPYFELDGRLDLNLATDGEAGAFIAGSGELHLTGEAELVLTNGNLLQHTGGTFIDNGSLVLVDAYAGDLTTTGGGVFELGEGGDFTGDLVNNGTFAFSQEADYDFLGNFSGNGLLEKYGAGTLTFEGLYAFEGTTSVFGGSVAFTGQLADDTELDLNEGSVDLSQVDGGQQTIGQLSGQGGSVELGETALTVNQEGNSTFGGSISGSGNLVKQGSGNLNLEGDGTGFTGTGQVDGGTLSVNGDFSNASFVVDEGGTLGGAGTVGNTNVNGGTAAPGNSIDTLTVNGDVSFTASSVFEVEVNADGDTDLLQATGTAALGGASVEVLAEAGTYSPITDYTILTADGGVSGEFGSVSTNFAFLDPSLGYSDTAVTLRLVRNDIDFSAFAATPNQFAIANLIEDLAFGNALYDETLMLADDDVVPNFSTLTGAVYPDYGSALIETAEMLRRQTGSGMTGSASGAYGWATGLYNAVDGGRTGLGGFGAAGGFGFAANGLSLALGVGMLGDDELKGDVTQSDLTFVTGQVAYLGLPSLSLTAGVQLGWSDGRTDRVTVLGSLADQLSAETESDYVQFSGEIAFTALGVAGLAVEPFIGISHVSLDLEAVNEAGGATALSVGKQDRAVTFGDLGVRFAVDAGGVRPYASAAYRRAWGDRTALASVAFAGNTGSAFIEGLPISKDAAELSAGLAIDAGIADFTIGYEGTVSDSFDSHGVNVGLRIRF